ncbi:MAG: glutamate decarboxylase [Bacillota bacterium]|nr:glutamate decarboxylase [Bacillota bacterium]
MWQVLYVAPSREVADRIVRGLAERGFLARVQAGGGHGGPSTWEILLPEVEIEEAQAALAEVLARAWTGEADGGA